MLLKVVILFLTLFLGVFGNSVQVYQDDAAVQGAEEFPACRCVFYEHCNYKGRRYCYNGNTKFVGWVSNDKFSSVRVTAGWMCKVFEHANYRGKSLILRRDDRCLTNNKLSQFWIFYKSWNDQISSVQVLHAPCRCRFYEHCGFRGRSVCYNRNTNWVGRRANDKFSAVRVQKGSKCTVYQHAHYRGSRATFYANDRCFTNNRRSGRRTWNDVISSVRVSRHNPCPCRLYQHCNYRGYSRCYTRNTGWVGARHNDEYSSIRVARGYKCQLFKHAHFKGNKITFGRNDGCFTNNKIGWFRNWNDIVSSVKVFRAHTLVDAPAQAQAQAQEQSDYMGYAVGGAVILSIAGVGLFAYKKRTIGKEDASNQEYEVLLQQS